MIKIPISIAFATTLLAGCVTIATPDASSSLKLSGNPTEGIVTGSITYDGRLSAYGVQYRRVGGGEPSGRLRVGVAMVPSLNLDTNDFDVEHLRGRVFSTVLPAGDYEINGWSIESGYVHVFAMVPFSVKFHVGPGAITYLGEFHFVQTDHMGLAVAGAVVSLRDQSNRDLPILFRKYPQFVTIEPSFALPRGTTIEYLGASSSTNVTIPPPYIPVIRK